MNQYKLYTHKYQELVDAFNVLQDSRIPDEIKEQISQGIDDLMNGLIRDTIEKDLPI